MTKIKNGMPTANIAINKSRLKIYKGDTPTYYLNRGEEFQIELFNTTNRTILCKIYLNSEAIAQGGLVLNPGERVFLERYIDVAKKFKFETYVVNGNNDEVKKAIENNGDFKVEFFYEEKFYPGINYQLSNYNMNSGYQTYNQYLNTFDTNPSNINTSGNSNLNPFTTFSTTTTSTNFIDSTNRPTLDWLEPNYEITNSGNLLDISNKKIETGRVAEGSYSDQEMTHVNKRWAFLPFHTVTYKLLPISQKVNTIKDTYIKKYCTSCGTKIKPTWKFCPTCSNKL